MTTKKQNAKIGGGKALPTAKHAVIKRAKKAIQKLLLNTNASKTEDLRANAEIEMANADKHCADRKDWRKEILIASNQPFCESVHNTSWYCKARAVQWSLTKMPEWANNGGDEPEAGTTIEGKPYVKAPPSQPR